MRIYVASSWRNTHQPEVILALRAAGHAVYDFRNPAPDAVGFGWTQVNEHWQSWSLEDYRSALTSEPARKGFERDRTALEWCDACVLVLPCGASAHLEAGWCAGREKPVTVYAPALKEPELMYKLFDDSSDERTPIFGRLSEVVAHVARNQSNR